MFEYAWQRNELDGLEALLADLDIGGLEISENYVSLTPDERSRMIEDFGTEVNLDNITPGQILRLEGFRRGIGRAVNYWIVSRTA